VDPRSHVCLARPHTLAARADCLGRGQLTTHRKFK
jgi:hypothetical protein